MFLKLYDSHSILKLCSCGGSNIHLCILLKMAKINYQNFTVYDGDITKALLDLIAAAAALVSKRNNFEANSKKTPVGMGQKM